VPALELLLDCRIVGVPAQAGTTPDDYQIGVEWLPLERIEEYNLMPRALRVALSRGDGAIYLGDVN
jgi:hypothetical protein